MPQDRTGGVGVVGIERLSGFGIQLRSHLSADSDPHRAGTSSRFKRPSAGPEGLVLGGPSIQRGFYLLQTEIPDTFLLVSGF